MSRIIHRVTRFFLWLIAGIVGLAVLIPVLLYVPFVQDFVKDIAVKEASKATGWQIGVDKLRLRWPLRVSVSGVEVLPAPGDTMLTAERLDVGVALWPLLRGDIDVNYARLDTAFYQMGTRDSLMWLRANIDRFELSVSRLTFKFDSISLSRAMLDGADVRLVMQPDTTVKNDTTTTENPLTIRAEEITMRRVHFAMSMLPTIDTLDCDVPIARLTDGLVDLGKHRISARSLTVDSVTAKYLTPPAGTTPVVKPTAEVATPTTEPYTITADTLRLTARRGLYGVAGALPQEGLDMNYLEVSDVAIEVDSFYNRGVSIRVPLRRLTARERCGLYLDASGVFEMDSTAMYAREFNIGTGASRMSVDAMMGLGDLTSEDLPLRLSADGSLSLSDAVKAYPGLRKTVAGLPSPQALTLKALIGGSSQRLSVNTLDVRYPSLLSLNASGTVNNPFDASRIGGKVTLDGKLTATAAVRRALLGSNSDLSLPSSMSVKGTVAYSPGNVSGDVAVTTVPTGRLAAKGEWHQRGEIYDATVQAVDFPVDAFMPSLGIGAVTADVKVTGHGYNPMKPSMTADLDCNIRHITYNRVPLDDITLKATVGGGEARGWLHSGADVADLDVDFDATVSDTSITWDVDGDIRRLDLQALGVSDTTMGGSMTIMTRGMYDPRSRSVSGSVTVDDLDMRMGDTEFTATETTARVSMTDTTLTARVTNGDLLAVVNAHCGLDTLLSRLGSIGTVVTNQIKSRSLNIDSLQHYLPPFTAYMNAGQNNILTEYLAPSGISFRSLGFAARNDSTITLRSRCLGFTSGATKTDTLTLNAIQRGSYLIYNAHMGNRPGTFDDFAQVDVNGYMGDNRLTAMLRQSNIKGEAGFRLGAMVTAADSTATLKLVPYNPMIAYRQWEVNPENRITYNFYTRDLDADLRLDDGRSSLSLQTEPTQLEASSGSKDLVLKLDNIHIQDWLSVSPFAPPVSGDVTANLRVNWANHELIGNGTVNLADFCYDRQRVGTFDLDVDLSNDQATGMVKADLSLMVDSVKTVTVTGVLNDSTAHNPFLLDFTMIRFPLKVANPFLPKNIAQLKGTLSGRMDVAGTPASPRFDGYLTFDSATVDVKMVGQTFRISDSRIPVDSNIVRFHDLSIYGANENPLRINGEVDLKSLTDIGIDLTAKANDMQIVNTNRPRGAEVYGKAWVNLDATVKGNMRFLMVDADATLVSGTNVTYVLGGGTQQLQQLSSGNNDMVRFVNFNDTTAVLKVDTIATGMAMMLEANLTIEEGTTVNVDISTDGHNKASIQGHGNLTYRQMPMAQTGTLTGRYTIDKGFVRYTPPMMSEKNFTLEEGSYVAFNGDILNPILDIHAVDALKANVTQEGQNSRLVTFNIGLSVTNTLQNMNVAFDLSTNDDITVQNELQGMTAEQRASQAMNLLLYNVYTGPGTKGNASIGGNVLFSFLESKINSWAASTIPGVDISFGIEQYDRTVDGNTSMTTSYSYRVSKSLFNDRFKIIVGGNYSTDADADENFSQNLINDISFEYLLNRSGSMYVRLFRHTGYESILEGEITQTGVGFVYRRKLDTLRDLFRFPSR